MSNSLVIYSSTDGHTKSICERIINFSDNENKVKIVSLNEAANFNLSEFNKIIIGASIRYGKHSKDLYKFIELNKSILDSKDGIFVSLARCTHGAANLCDGYFDGRNIECPLHQGLFSVKDGEPKAAPARIPLKIFKTRVLVRAQDCDAYLRS